MSPTHLFLFNYELAHRSAVYNCIFSIFADEKPDLVKLLSFPGKSNIDISEQIGTKYFKFGVLLLNDKTGAEVSAIVKEHRENAAEINLEILRLWIGGKGQPLSWDTLISVLQSIGLETLASDIKGGLHHSILQ